MRKCMLVIVLAVILSIASFSVAGAQGGGNLHYVTYGDTLYSISTQYGVPAEAIMRYNGIVNPNMIYAGQPLMIPGGPPGGYGQSPVTSGCGSYHSVVYGETLSGIAYQYGLSMHELMMRNALYNQDMVYAGQRLCVPAPSYTAQPASYKPAPKHIPPPAPAPLPAPPPAPHPMPPPVPKHGGGDYDKDKYDGRPHDGGAAQEAPPAPEYQTVPKQPLLPRAKHPIEVVVNGGGVWTGQAYESYPDPDGNTVLIVSTRDSEEPIVKLRSGDYEVKGELGLVPEFGVDQFRFVFRYIPPGDYDVWFEDPELPSEKVPVTVEPGRRVEVNFRRGVGYTGPTFASPSGWVLGNWSNPSKPGENIGGWSNILVKTPASGLWVLIESEGGGYKAKCFTGTKGPGACDFAGLNAGLYWIWIDGTDLTLKTYMDGNAYAEFEFNRQPDGPTTEEKSAVGPVSYSN